MNDYREENTISLFDLWNVLSRHKKLFWINFSIFFIVGALFIFIKSPQYTYTQIIELPSYVDNKEVIAVWPYDLVVEKIRKFYLPLAESKYNEVHKDKVIHLDSNFLMTDNVGGYLSLSLEGPIDAWGGYKEILRVVLENLHAETAVILNERADYLKSVLTNLQIQKNDSKALRIKKTDNFVIYEYMRSGMQIDQRINDVNYKLESLRQATASELIRSNLPVGTSKIVLLVLFMFVEIALAGFIVLGKEIFEKK
jgi:hypothetical protein